MHDVRGPTHYLRPELIKESLEDPGQGRDGSISVEFRYAGARVPRPEDVEVGGVLTSLGKPPS